MLKSTARKKGIDEGKGRRAIAAAAAMAVKVIRILKFLLGKAKKEKS